MGVPLGTLIKTERIPLSRLKGTKVAVDGMQMLFQILYNPYYRALSKSAGESDGAYKYDKKIPEEKISPQKHVKTGVSDDKRRPSHPDGIRAQYDILGFEHPVDKTQRVYLHLYGWLGKVIHFLKAGILPIVVFDGKPSHLKLHKYTVRENDFLEARNYYNEFIKKGAFREAKNIATSYNYLLWNCKLESEMILKSCGIPVLHAPDEAEALCTYLQKENYVDYVISTDFDAILYGAKKIIRKITFAPEYGRARKQAGKKGDQTGGNTAPGNESAERRRASGTDRGLLYVEYIDSERALKTLGITREQLIDLSFIIGNDYFKGIKGLGPKKGLILIKKYGSLENIRKVIPDMFKELPEAKYRRIKRIFTDPPAFRDRPGGPPGTFSIEDHNEFGNMFRLRSYAPSQIKRLCIHEHGLSRRKIESYINRLEYAHRRYTSTFYGEHLPELGAPNPDTIHKTGPALNKRGLNRKTPGTAADPDDVFLDFDELYPRPGLAYKYRNLKDPENPDGITEGNSEDISLDDDGLKSFGFKGTSRSNIYLKRALSRGKRKKPKRNDENYEIGFKSALFLNGDEEADG